MKTTQGRVNGFIQLERQLVRSDRWQGLSPGARALLIEIWAEHDGHNNGQIRYGTREAEASLRCSRSTAKRWFDELEDAHLIEAVERGGFRWKSGARQGLATAWRITVQKATVRKSSL
jgi:hypothetical protein